MDLNPNQMSALVFAGCVVAVMIGAVIINQYHKREEKEEPMSTVEIARRFVLREFKNAFPDHPIRTNKYGVELVPISYVYVTTNKDNPRVIGKALLDIIKPIYSELKDLTETDILPEKLNRNCYRVYMAIISTKQLTGGRYADCPWRVVPIYGDSFHMFEIDGVEYVTDGIDMEETSNHALYNATEQAKDKAWLYGIVHASLAFKRLTSR